MREFTRKIVKRIKEVFEFIERSCIKLFPHDKCLHFIMGEIIFCVAGILFSAVQSFCVVVVAALLKEVYDVTCKQGVFDDADVWFTVSGASFAYLACQVF